MGRGRPWCGCRPSGSDSGFSKPTRALTFEVAACWACGTTAIRLEDWPYARQLLEEAVRLGAESDEIGEVVALALLDLARVHEAAGDVVEARRLVIRAASKGREHGLPSYAPRRWRDLVDYGRNLELEL